MSDSTENNSTTQDNNESETQRLHRLVLPMILDLLRQRNRRNRNNRPSSRTHFRSPLDSENTRDNRSLLPPLVDPEDDSPNHGQEDMSLDNTPPIPSTPPNSSADSMDDAQEHNNALNRDETSDTNQDDQRAQDTEDTTPTSQSTSPNSSRRPRYRLVVYFEERDLPAGTEETATSSTTTDATTNEEGEQEPRDIATPTPQRSSRYVAIFSVDSDDQDMPIIHSAGLQNTYANFDDILNQLFNSYVPKGTPPAKKDVIDTLPTAAFSAVSIRLVFMRFLGLTRFIRAMLVTLVNQGALYA